MADDDYSADKTLADLLGLSELSKSLETCARTGTSKDHDDPFLSLSTHHSRSGDDKSKKKNEAPAVAPDTIDE